MTAAQFYRKHIGMGGRSVFSKEQLDIVNALNKWRDEYSSIKEREAADKAFDAGQDYSDYHLDYDPEKGGLPRRTIPLLKEDFLNTNYPLI